MRLCKIKVNENLYEPLLVAIKESTSCKYENQMGGTQIIVGEDYRLRTTSYVVHIILIEKKPPFLEIHILTGGESDSALLFGANNATIKRITSIIQSVCNEHNEKLEIIESTKL